MMKFLKFSLARYAKFGSYAAAFLAGVGCSISASYFWIPLAVAIVLGSLSAYLSSTRPRVREDAPRPRAADPSPASLVDLDIDYVIHRDLFGNGNTALNFYFFYHRKYLLRISTVLFPSNRRMACPDTFYRECSILRRCQFF